MDLAIVTKIPEKKVLDVFTAKNGLDPYMQMVRDEIDDFKPDLTTAKGRKEIASMANKVAKAKTALDKMGKDLVAELKKQPALVDAERKRMRDTFDEWKKEVRAPLTEYEEAEKKRVEEIQDRVKEINTLAIAEFSDAEEIVPEMKERIDVIENIEIDENFEEFRAIAEQAKHAALTSLKDKLKHREKYEADQRELVILRQKQAEQEEKERKERLEREAKERQEKMEREAKERAEREAEEKIRREKELAEQEAQAQKQKADEAERRRIAAEERAAQVAIETEKRIKREAELKAQEEAKEKARREADLLHRTKTNRAAADAFMSIEGVDENLAKEIVSLIVKNQVPNIRINY
jgi:hypothetical protein